MNELKKYENVKKGIVTAFKAISVIILILLQIAFLFFLFSFYRIVSLIFKFILLAFVFACIPLL